MIGFPLRLLAKVYDKAIKQCDPTTVKLITGEKNYTNKCKYFLCTVESMPIDKKLEFVAIDEIQIVMITKGSYFYRETLNLRGEKQTCLWDHIL